MSEKMRRKLTWRSKRANHGRKPTLGKRRGQLWKKRGRK